METILIRFARLWGQREIQDNNAFADNMSEYDAEELQELFEEWANDYYYENDDEDVEEFFAQKINDLFY